MTASALTINGGSSSIKFAVYALADPPQQTLSGEIARIGLPDAALSVKEPGKETIAAADRCGRSFAGRRASDRVARRANRAAIARRRRTSDRAWRAESLAAAIGFA